jgi:3-phenylpropionate/trans-cinnamate dioxygenase ferredoxin reductase component
MIVIAGGGLAAQRCCERLRRKDYDGPITMVCDEPHAPYDRPPLSKEYLAGTMTAPPRLRPDGWHSDHDVELLLDVPATGLRPDANELVLAGGRAVRYEQLLVATGAAPRTLPGLDRFENVHVLRTLADAERLRDALAPGSRVAVVGAGFIGQEVASTARKLGAEVTLIEAMAAPLAHVVGTQVGDWFARLHREHGVRTLMNATFDPHWCAEYDQVVVGIGVVPATEWLRGTPIGPNGAAAIRADHAGRTCIPNVFAAGDCAGGQHWEAAVGQGGAAALAMVGEDPPAAPPSSFWSDLYDIRINWLGDARGADSVEIEGEPEARDFRVTYRREGRVIAGLLVGRPHQLPELRKELR